MLQRTYLHFSCHGNYDWNDPSASGLYLADKEYLALADLQRGGVDLSAVRLVTLSACESGMTDILQGNPAEYVGIPAGFLLAGAASVISSLWSVEDFPTALIMEQFYRNHLVEHMDIRAELQHAQIWLRDLHAGEVAACIDQWYQQSLQKDRDTLLRWALRYRLQARQSPTLRPFAHPYYWAAFTINGW